MSATVLRTARLLLRPWRDADVAAFDELNTDAEVMKFLPVLSDWPARARAHWETHGFGQWVVELPDITGFIGVVGLNCISYPAHFTPAVEVAWRLARAYWGRGYATEAAGASVDYGFEKLGLAEIVATTVPANQRSRRVMERLGMTYAPQDDFDHPRVLDAHLRRHVLYRTRRSALA